MSGRTLLVHAIVSNKQARKRMMRQSSRQDEEQFGLIHLLNQRYREEFARAEALQAELEDIRGSRLWPWFQWLRRLRRFFARKPTSLPLPFSGGEGWGEGLFTPCPDLKYSPAQVSIIIPLRDQYELLARCVQPLRTAYTETEIILVDNGSEEPQVQQFLRQWSERKRSVAVPVPGPFNFSSLCNAGAAVSKGKVLLFLNNDVLARDSGWLEAMLEVIADPRVGVVGASLFYPDRTIQHVGLSPSAPGQTWVHPYRFLPETHAGDENELTKIRFVPAVTGACLMIRREVFELMSGFDECLPVAMNDVDLCQRVRKSGLNIAITPFARLWHFESLSRGYQREVG